MTIHWIPSVEVKDAGGGRGCAVRTPILLERSRLRRAARLAPGGNQSSLRWAMGGRRFTWRYGDQGGAGAVKTRLTIRARHGRN